MPQRLAHFIGGDNMAASGGEYFDSINPSDGSVAAQVARGTPEDIDKAVAAANAAAKQWRDMRPLERGQVVSALGRLILDNLDELAKIESDDMGMPVLFASMSIRGAANYFIYYGGLAPSIQGENIQIGPAQHSYTIYQPYGVVGIITPWNAPLNQAARSMAPALAAGNTVVLKPSEYTSVTTVKFAQMAEQAGVPPGVLNVVTGYGAETGEPLVRHKGVHKVSFTGSVATGIKVGVMAAEKVMRVSLEMGGKSPDIVFEDADLEAALPGVTFGLLANSGQICLAGTRILVQRSVYDQFSQMLVQSMESMSIGRDKDFPALGPIANQMQFDKVMDYLDSAKKDGATLLTGGERATDGDLKEGLYIKPTLYTDVSDEMRIVKEEIFGPVGVLIPFDTEEEAIAIANNTDFGLAAGVWTRDVSRAIRVSEQLEVGQIYVNYYIDSGVESPLGGHKKSGLGHEKGVTALRNYTQMKNVSIAI